MIAILSVWEGANKPYVANGVFFIQVANSIEQATPSDVLRLFEEKKTMDDGWERMPLEGITEKDLDEDAMLKLKSALVRKDPEYGEASRERILRFLGFVRSGVMTNAGVVVLAKQPSVYLPQTRIRVSVFADKNGRPALVDVRLYDASLVSDVDTIAAFLYSLYPKRVLIEGMMRIEVEPLPLVAIREGLLNACVHRTYDSYQSFVAVNVYANRLEIVNSGDLMEGVTIAELKGTHRSLLRNPDIANAFYQLGYIEMAGSGTLRIIDACLRNRCEEPVWSNENGCVTLTFPNIYHNLEQERENKPVDLSQLTTDATVRESLKVILEYVVEHQSVKLQELVEVTGKSYPSVKRYMQILKEAGLIEYIGSLRSGGWSLKL